MSPSNEARVLMLFECYNDKTSCNWNKTKISVIISLLLDYIVKVLSVYCKLWWLILVNTVTHHLMRSAPMTSCIWYWSPSLQTLGHFLCSNSWKKKTKSLFSIWMWQNSCIVIFTFYWNDLILNRSQCIVFAKYAISYTETHLMTSFHSLNPTIKFNFMQFAFKPSHTKIEIDLLIMPHLLSAVSPCIYRICL